MLGNFRARKYEVNLVIDTAAYASGDLLSDRVAIDLTGKGEPVSGEVVGFTLLDKDDEGGLLDIVFLDSNVSLGTINAAPSISDTNAQQLIAPAVPVSSYTDMGGCQIAGPSFDPIPFETATGILYVAAISRDTKTYTAASDLRLKVMIRLHNVNK